MKPWDERQLGLVAQLKVSDRPGVWPAGGGGRPAGCTAVGRPGSPRGAAEVKADVHFWLLPPLQVYRMSCVPLAVLEAGSSRHFRRPG